MSSERQRRRNDRWRKRRGWYVANDYEGIPTWYYKPKKRPWYLRFLFGKN